MSNQPEWIEAARAHWRWRGQERPEFAQVPCPGQVSVWDFPRPPALVEDAREVRIDWGRRAVVLSRRALCVLETGHPPCVYVPWADVERSLLQPAGGGSFCEWKGPAEYWDLVDGPERLARVAWSYPRPLVGAEVLSDRVAFYPAQLACEFGGEPVQPQPGGFYGGWITSELVGPFKGAKGTERW